MPDTLSMHQYRPIRPKPTVPRCLAPFAAVLTPVIIFGAVVVVYLAVVVAYLAVMIAFLCAIFAPLIAVFAILVALVFLLLSPWLGSLAWLLEKLHVPGCELRQPYPARAAVAIGIGVWLVACGIFFPIRMIGIPVCALGFVLVFIGSRARRTHGGELLITLFGFKIRFHLG